MSYDIHTKHLSPIHPRRMRTEQNLQFTELYYRVNMKSKYPRAVGLLRNSAIHICKAIVNRGRQSSVFTNVNYIKKCRSLLKKNTLEY